MKTFKRMTAMVLAIAAMAAGMSSVAAGAEEHSRESVHALDDRVEAMCEEIAQLASTANNATFTAYSYHETNRKCPTPHYISATGRIARGSTVNFYFTTNAFSSDYASSSRFTLCDNFTAMGMTVSAPVTVDNQIKRVPVNLSGYVNAGAYSEIIRYKADYDSTVVTSEYDLFLYSSLDTSDGEDFFYTTNTSFRPEKIIYAMGDVNRDGYFNSTDTVLTQLYINGEITVDDGREEYEDADRLAFTLAADVNRDGVVTSSDINYMSRVLLGIDTFS